MKSDETGLENREGRGLSLHPLWQLTLSRVREFAREPEALFWSYVFPVLLALALGIAFRSRPPERARVVVESGPEAGAVVALLAGSGEIAAEAVSGEDAEVAMRRGRADLRVRLDGAGGYVFEFDPTRSESRVARLLAERALGPAPGAGGPVISEERITAPGSRYIDFLIPGLIGMNLMGSGMWGVGFNIVQARSRKLLRRMTATPMRRSHFLFSYILSRILFLVPEVAILLLFGRLVFGVRLEGSVIGVGVIALMGALMFSGLGLLTASRAATVEAVSGWMNFAMLPMWVLSGSLFSYERFPAVFIPLIRLLPLTAVNDALRAVMSDGASLAGSWSQLAVMAGWGLLSFGLALRLFKWQ